VCYFQAIADDAVIAETQQFQWPLSEADEEQDEGPACKAMEAAEEAAASLELPEPENEISGSGGAAASDGQPEQAHAYVEFTAMGDQFCMLCARSGGRHLRSVAHGQTVAHWSSLVFLLDRMHQELKKATPSLLVGDNRSVSEGSEGDHVLVAWRGELRRVLRLSEVPRAVKGVFWHRVVLPHLPSAASDRPALDAVAAMLKAARNPEPAAAALSVEASPTDCERLELVEQASHRVRAQINSSEGLRQDTLEGLNQLLGAIQELRAYALEYRSLPAVARDVLASGQNAVRNFCERPARQELARAWLRRRGLEHCASLLIAQGLLGRLHEVAAKPSCAEKVGLPRRCREALAAAAAGDALTEMHFLPRGVPTGWKRVFSRSVGMEYFMEATSSRTQWEWPTATTNEEDPPGRSVSEPAEPARPAVGAPLDGTVPYVELDLTCAPFCLLCGAGGRRHLASERHAAARRRWLERLGHLESLLPELRLAVLDAADAGGARLPATVEAWRGELLQAVAPIGSSGDGDAGGAAAGQAEQPQHDLLSRALWHCLVRPKLPSAGASLAYLEALAPSVEAMLRAGRSPEPSMLEGGF